MKDANGKSVRVYAVFDDGKPHKLVRAGSNAQSIAHAVGSRFEAVVADADHVSQFTKLGLEIEDAGQAPLTKPPVALP